MAKKPRLLRQPQVLLNPQLAEPQPQKQLVAQVTIEVYDDGTTRTTPAGVTIPQALLLMLDSSAAAVRQMIEMQHAYNEALAQAMSAESTEDAGQDNQEGSNVPAVGVVEGAGDKREAGDK